MVSLVEVERYLKRIVKNKVKISKNLILLFLISGNFVRAEVENTTIGDTYTGTYSGAILSIGGDKTIVKDNLSYEIQEKGDNEARIDVTNGNLIVKDKLNITIKPEAGNKFTRPKGIIVRGRSDSDIKNLKVDIALASEKDVDRGSADSNAAYGVAVGYDGQGGTNKEITILKVNNADIKVTNTENTVFWKKDAKGIAKVTFGHQLSGLKVFRGNGAIPEFISNGTVNITVEDKSKAKSGDYLVGVYVSGEGSNVKFNGDTTIKVKANGKYSAGIKIGKSGDNKGSATVTANGKLVVDTTETKDSAAVRLFSKNSKFEVTGRKTDKVSEIKSGNSAIVFDTQDYVVKGNALIFFTIGASRNENVENPVVKLNDTILTTTSDNASLIKVKAEKVVDETMGYASSFDRRLNSGNFNVTNAKFTLKGEKSLATAPSNGWLIEVQGLDGVSSDLTANIEKGAKIVGLTHKEKESSLIMNIDKATWQLKKKGETKKTTAKEINLKEGATLDASVLTDDKKSEYTIKLTSDGTKSDGTLTNAGIINLVNKSYEDVLTIEGDYKGDNGVIKLNTLWDSPADDKGSNSKSDKVVIEGNVSGKTDVIVVNNKGEENAIDGTIGDIDADLEKVTVPVIKVKGSSLDTFTGKAQTTGAGEVQLIGKEKDGYTEYYWTLKALNKKDPTPIISQSVPGYVQMPKANLDIAFDSLRTLDEREGKDEKGKAIWARVLGGKNTYQGKERFNMSRTNVGVQVGARFLEILNKKGTRNISGAYLAYQKSKLHFEDIERAENGVVVEDKYTGFGNVHAVSLGLTNTTYTKNGEYVDLVGQLSFLSNEYNSRDDVKAKNSSIALALSAELGKPYTLKENKEKNQKLILEPQAQIIYQKLITRKFEDANKKVDQGTVDYLKGRIGLRLVYNHNDKSYYAGLNLWHDFLAAGKVKIGEDSKEEKYINSTIELALGLKYPILKKGNIYADFRYQHSLGKLKNNSIKGTVGLKYYFD